MHGHELPSNTTHKEFKPFSSVIPSTLATDHFICICLIPMKEKKNTRSHSSLFYYTAGTQALSVSKKQFLMDSALVVQSAMMNEDKLNRFKRQSQTKKKNKTVVVTRQVIPKIYFTLLAAKQKSDWSLVAYCSEINFSS